MASIRRSTLLLLVLTMTSPLLAAERTRAEAESLTKKVLAEAIVIDTHADTPQMMLDEGYDLGDPSSPYMISIPKMRAGHEGAQFFSIWVPVDWPAEDLIHRALDLMDVVDEQVVKHSDSLEFASTADDVVRIHRAGKIAALMVVEGGHIIENDLRVLDMYYRLGVRYMTLTHTKNTAWADSSGDHPRWNGLTDFGKQVVLRMNRLGMMVDISHVADKTFEDAVEVSKAPIIASHSSCRALCPAPRDLTDDMLRQLARNGGVVDINFYSAFLDPQFREAQAKILPKIEAAVSAERDRLAKQGQRLSYPKENEIRVKMEAELVKPSYRVIADHIDHAVKVAGADHVGLGSDFDGVDAIPRGMEDVSKLPNLIEELARRGYSEEDLIKILGGNVLRVMRRAEEVSRQMQSD